MSLLRGKLSWKLDCAARWNLYQVHTEVFSKAHLGDKSTLDISTLVSRRFFGNHTPATVGYGDLRMSPRLSGRLLDMLPPVLLKRLLTERLQSDMDLTGDSIEHFANSFEIRPGMSYGNYVRRELPRAALVEPSTHGNPSHAPSGLSEAVLVAYGNRFSEFFYQRRHELRWPDARTLEAANFTTVETTREVIEYALALRREAGVDPMDLKARLKTYLAGTPTAPAVYPFLRKVFQQSHGASITTLLCVLPTEYLSVVHLMLSCLTGTIQAKGGPDDEIIEEREAA